jgi:hypothetical protein
MAANLSPGSATVAGAADVTGRGANEQAAAVRLRWFVGISAVLALVVGVTVVVYDRVEGFNGPDDQVVDAPAEDPGADGLVAAGATRVEGTVTTVHLEGAVPDPRLVPAPLTLVSERGFGNGGEVTGVEVGGRRSVIVWDGGRPFVLASGAGLVLDPVTVDLVPGGLRAGLGGAVHALGEGEHRLDTPVAVGQAGVATPYDAVTFTAGPDAQLEAAGDTALVFGPDGAHRFGGPGVARLEGEDRKSVV